MRITDTSITTYSPRFSAKKSSALFLLREHTTLHDGYIAWSGGKDSTAVLALMQEAGVSVPVVWFNSGLEYPETREYMLELVDMLGCDFHEFPVSPNGLELLAASGFWTHVNPLVGSLMEPASDDLHEALILEPARRAHEVFGEGEVLGFRAGESAGRRALLARAKGTYQRKDGTVVACPVWDWTANEVEGYLQGRGVPLNPVYGKLKALGAPEYAQRVGLVVDGNAMGVGRYTWLKNGWPEMWNELCHVLPRLGEWR